MSRAAHGAHAQELLSANPARLDAYVVAAAKRNTRGTPTYLRERRDRSVAWWAARVTLYQAQARDERLHCLWLRAEAPWIRLPVKRLRRLARNHLWALRGLKAARERQKLTHTAPRWAMDVLARAARG